MCINGLCVTSPNAPSLECPYGDDLVHNATYDLSFSNAFVTCEEFISSLRSNSYSEAYFCSSSYGIQRCCKTCLSRVKFIVNFYI